MDFFVGGGVMMWPILVCTLLVLGLAARTAIAGARGGSARAHSEQSAVLFWGVAAAVLGVLGTLVGVMQMAEAVERAGMIQSATLWGGERVNHRRAVGVRALRLNSRKQIRTRPADCIQSVDLPEAAPPAPHRRESRRARRTKHAIREKDPDRRGLGRYALRLFRDSEARRLRHLLADQVLIRTRSGVLRQVCR